MAYHVALRAVTPRCETIGSYQAHYSRILLPVNLPLDNRQGQDLQWPLSILKGGDWQCSTMAK